MKHYSSRSQEYAPMIRKAKVSYGQQKDGLHIDNCYCCGRARSGSPRTIQLGPLDRIFCSSPSCAMLKMLINEIFKPTNVVIEVNCHHSNEPARQTLSAVPNNVAELPQEYAPTLQKRRASSR